ncbi:hypothetical protein Pryu01_01851 [Paraliobacillus ryukyuensis]|uniref:Uncharacterized protein n=1 Tax=Paraliobacillus ryukyuensis TaxID=200904 RepID=A0A366DSX1_9BACI|nr:hypothetical protein DES48_11349 [Paraliobacillus ryukyuensis]
MIASKYKIIYKKSCTSSVSALDYYTCSIRGYIVLLASKGARKQNILLLTATKIITSAYYDGDIIRASDSRFHVM